MNISNQNYWPLVNYRDAQGRGFPCACRNTTYGRLKTMEASSKWNQIVCTKTHQGKKFRNLIHIRFILVINSKSNQTVLLFRYFTRFRECTAVWLQYRLSVLTWSGALDSWRQTDSWFSVSVCDSVLVPICIQHLCLQKKAQSESQTCHLIYGKLFT